MALTDLQRRICRLLAQNRIASGESYIAGGVALNELMAASRISRVFHRGRIRGAVPRLVGVEDGVRWPGAPALGGEPA